MPYRATLPSLTRFTFGTGKVDQPDDATHLAVTRAAMDAGVWFHSSHVYGNGRVFETLKKAFAEDRKRIPKCIFKVDGLGADLLRETVEASITGTGVERVDIAQVCGNPKFETLRPGGAMYDTMCELKDKGLVGSYVLEIFWSGSPNAIQSVRDDLFDAYIFYYNLVNREVSNDLYAAMHEKKVNILSLRTVGGGPENFNDTRVPDEARTALEDIYRRSGCKSRVEFRVRYVLSDPLVKTTIGATNKLDHLKDLLTASASHQPLQKNLVDEINVLHNQWFATHGLA